jgi:hypothetical protein
MLDHDDVEDVNFDVFGLEGTFPRPGWVVLDAARRHGFTGELTFETIPTVKVYLDGGLIYLAERVTDPSLGSRLVDAGALNAAQLEHGSMQLGDVAHLGRLFERVPSVNRQTVMVMTEMMTEECVGWLASQLVRDVDAAPYRHHPAGIQRWLHPLATHQLAPGDPLPAPPADAAPVELLPPESLFSSEVSFDDGIITWDQPSWLDERRPARSPTEPQSNQPVAPVDRPADPDVAPDVSGPSDAGADADAAATPAGSIELPELPVRIPHASEVGPTPDPSDVRRDAARDWVDQVVAATESDASDTEPSAPDLGDPTAARPVLDVQSALDRLSVPPSASAAATRTTDVPLVPPSTDQLSLVVESALDRLSVPPSASAAAAPRSATDLEIPDTERGTTVPDEPADRPGSGGLLGPNGQPLLSTALPAPDLTVDGFEVIWPSGEVDDPLGSHDAGSLDQRRPELDGAGSSDPTTPADGSDDDVIPTLEVRGSVRSAEQPEQATDVAEGHDEVTDEVVLAVRRAVASIETSSLAARRRLVATDRADDPSRGVGPPTEHPVRSLRPVSATSDSLTPGAYSARRAPTRSVFDDDGSAVPADTGDTAEPVLPVAPGESADSADSAASAGDQGGQRVGALRRLIGSLRRH